MEIVSRSDARALGVKRYFTGRPCKYGHLCERFVANFCCVECNLKNFRNWVMENPEKEKARSLARRGCATESSRARARARRGRNREKENARNRVWHRENSSKVSACKKKWRAENPVKASAIDRRKGAKRRFLKSGSFEHHTARDVKRILENQKHKCVNCCSSLRKEYHVDHITPLALGGGNGPENIQCLCPKCNMSKGALDPVKWAQREGRLV